MSGAPEPYSADEGETKYDEALVEVAAIALCNADDSMSHHEATDDHPCSVCREKARVAYDALADRLVALGEQRGKEGDLLSAIARVTPCSCSAQRARAERAEADLAAAEQRGGEKALREAADAVPGASWMQDTVGAFRVWLRARADRLGTQAEGEA